MNAFADLSVLERVLHPLASPPDRIGWNHAELDGLLPDGEATRDAAVLVGLVDHGDGLRVILTRRSDAMRQHAGQVSFPGGRVDPQDDGLLHAALREAHEEIGLPPDLATPLGWLDPLTTISNYRVLPVVAGISPAFVARPCPGEVADVFEVPLDFLLAPDSLSRVALHAGGRMRHVFEFRPYDAVPERRIWGATAAILFNLRQRLERMA